MLNMVYVVMFDKIPKGEAGRSRPRCLMFFGRGRLMAHLDRRRGFGVVLGRGFCGGGSSSLHLIYFSGAQFPFRVAGGLEGGEKGFV
jgi:hypothetical protein